MSMQGTSIETLQTTGDEKPIEIEITPAGELIEDPVAFFVRVATNGLEFDGIRQWAEAAHPAGLKYTGPVNQHGVTGQDNMHCGRG